MKQRTIFVHGMFLNPKSWNAWISYFEERGYDCEAPAWPLHEGEPLELRQSLPAGLGRLTLAQVHARFQEVLRREAQPPIVIGHSLGGLITQKLVAEGLARAGVCIASVAPNRMLAMDWGFLRNSASITNPFAGSEPYLMTEEIFRKNFGNAMPEEASQGAYEAFAVHESRQVLRDILGPEGVIDLGKPHAPLLFIGAENDEIIPASLVRRNAHGYQDPHSHHEYREFSGRGHFLCGQEGWQEIAQTIANWLEAHLSEAPPHVADPSDRA